MIWEDEDRIVTIRDLLIGFVIAQSIAIGMWIGLFWLTDRCS